MRENETCLYQEWQQMPTQELDRILQAELEKDCPDEKVVLPILKTLEQREKDTPVEMTPEVLTILNKLSNHEASFKQSRYRRKWIAGIAGVAAAACIVVMALPRTVGAESIFDVLFRWTSGVFEFFNREQDESNPPVDAVFETDNPGLQQLQDKITGLGVTEPVVPMWLPEGFVLTELDVLPIFNGNRLYGKVENGSKVIVFTYRISADIAVMFEKEDSAVEVYDYGGVSHFILDNGEMLSVTWRKEGVECLLNANIAKEELYAILKSIYRSELS